MDNSRNISNGLNKAALGIVWMLFFGQFAHAQTRSVLLEACNQMKDSKKRMACLLEATKVSQAPAQISPVTKVEPPTPKELTAEDAIDVCALLVSSLKTDRTLAHEDIDESTGLVLAVSWSQKPEDSKSTCGVDRKTRELVSMVSKGKKLPPELLADMIRRTKMRKEIDSGKYENFVAYAKAGLTDTLKDPSSAQFRDLFLSGKAMPVLCGEINSKNSYGAYVGFSRFYATGTPSLNSIETKKEDYVFNRMWPSMCGEKTTDVQ